MSVTDRTTDPRVIHAPSSRRLSALLPFSKDDGRPFVGGARTVILCYHRVAERPMHRYHLCVTPENFAAQLRLLRRRADPATLDDVLVPSRRPRFVVTFDDGYADNATTAAPIAEELGVPITVYVTSGMIGTTSGFWWDRLARIIDDPDAKVATGWQIADDLSVDLASPEARERTLWALHRWLRQCSPDVIAERLSLLAHELGTDASVAEEDRPMSLGQLGALDARPCTTIGAHTVAHELLAGRDLPSQFASIVASKVTLEELLGHRVSHLAYPFGGESDIDAASATAAAAADFVTASTTRPGSLQRSASRYELRRRMVMDWGARRFEFQLRRWGL